MATLASPVSLQETQYCCRGLELERVSKVVYVICDHAVYFSGVECLDELADTIGSVSRVIEAIAKQEQFDATAYRWFDVQTHRGYPDVPAGQSRCYKLTVQISPVSGCVINRIFVVNSDGFIREEVIMGDYFWIASWVPRNLPKDLEPVFAEYICGVGRVG